MNEGRERSEFWMSAVARRTVPPHVRLGHGMVARVLMALVRLYQLLLSPLLGGRCRFEPSCSRYAMACLETHGAMRGSLLSVRRLCKCHPFHPGGHDPPPAKAAVTRR